MNLTNEQYGLLFDVRRSIRYHDRRRSWFDRLHRLTSVLTILLAGGVLFELAGTGEPALWLRLSGAVAAILAAIDMVVGYAACATRHTNLRERFANLEIKMTSGDATEDIWRSYTQERLKIERDEPPVYRALDLLCHNEQCKAEGHDFNYFAHVDWFKRLTCNLFTYSDINPYGPEKTKTVSEQ